MKMAEAASSDLELCIVCMNSFIADPDGTYIRQVCNHPTEKHYCCIECLEKYETQQQERFAKERRFFTMYSANVHPPQHYPKATYGHTKCPCSGCDYSFHPIRDGPTKLFHTKREGWMPMCCLFEACGKRKTTIYMSSNALSKVIRANIEMYEIANFKEGRLDGKYLIIHLYKKILPTSDNLLLDQWTSDSSANMRPTAMVALLTFENGLIKSAKEHISLKHRQISEYMEELYLSRFSSEIGKITPDKIYHDLLEGGVSSPVPNPNPYHLALMNEYQYEMNLPTYSRRDRLVYDMESIHYYEVQEVQKEPPSPDFPQGYYSRPVEINENTLYLTPEILKKMAIEREGDDPPISNFPFQGDHQFRYYLKTKRDLYKLTKNSEDTTLTLCVEHEYKIITSTYIEQECIWKTSYYDNGNIHCKQRNKGSYETGLMYQDGPEIYYYDNGQLKVISHYVNDKKEGYLFEYERNSGAITGYAFYQKGKRTLLFQG
jgi:hypothetical protein